MSDRDQDPHGFALVLLPGSAGPSTRCCSQWMRRISIVFLVLCRPYHTLLFLVDEKDIHDVPCVLQVLLHPTVPDGEGYL